MNMEWTKDLSIPFRYKEDIFNGTRRTVYLYTYIAVGKHIEGHWVLFGLFHNNQGKRPKIIPKYFRYYGEYSDYKIKGKKLVLCNNEKMAYRFQSLPVGDPYDNLNRIGKADKNNKELQHILYYLHKLGLETYVNYAVQERWSTM